MQAPTPRSPRGRLADPRYRAEMLARLDSLVAVLQVAQRQARAARGGSAEPAERLDSMAGNLARTLEICQFARRRLTAKQSKGVVGERRTPEMRHFVESLSFSGFQRLQAGAKINVDAISAEDLELLCTQLSEETEL